MAPLVPCAHAAAQLSSRIIAAPNKFLLIHASKISGIQRRPMRNGGRYRSVTAIGTPEFSRVTILAQTLLFEQLWVKPEPCDGGKQRENFGLFEDVILKN